MADDDDTPEVEVKTGTGTGAGPGDAGDDLAIGRLDAYGRLLAELRAMLAHETGSDNGLDALTDRQINRTIRTLLAGVRRLAREG